MPPDAEVAAQELDGRRRRPGPRVEQRDRRLAPRERRRDDRQVPDDERDEAEPDPRLEDREEAAGRGVRRHVAETEREEGRAAHVERGHERVAAVGRSHPRAGSPLHERKGEDHRERPQRDQQQQPERSVDGQEVLAAVAALHASSDGAPGGPGQPVEEDREAVAARDAAREDHRLEGVPERRHEQEDADEEQRHRDLGPDHGAIESLPRSAKKSGPAVGRGAWRSERTVGVLVPRGIRRMPEGPVDRVIEGRRAGPPRAPAVLRWSTIVVPKPFR